MVEIKIDNQRLDRINKGHNFLNFENEVEKKYNIEVMLVISQNLKEKDEDIRISSNLQSWYGRENDLDNFFKELERECKKPFIIVRNFNRKDRVCGYYEGFRNGFRGEVYRFEDIKFSIGELAETELEKLGINFKEKVKEILKLQKTDKKLQELADEFILLKEKMLTLKSIMGFKNEYRYGKKTDDTIKLELTSEQYNENLRKIEVEIRKIAKKLNISINDYDFKYIKDEVEEEVDEEVEEY